MHGVCTPCKVGKTSSHEKIVDNRDGLLKEKVLKRYPRRVRGSEY